MFRVRVLSGKSLCFLACRFAELFDEAFSFGDFVCMVSSTLVRKWVKQIQSFAPSSGTFTAHSQLCRPSQGLKPQAYNPTHPLLSKHQDFPSRYKGDSWTNVLWFALALPCWMLNLLLLTISTDAKHFLFWRWPGSGKAQNWILFKSIFESLYGLLFVVTRSSCAPSTLFGLCFCVFGGSAKDNCLRCHHQNLLQLQTAFVQMNL